jgi:hypothetical protein
MNKIRIIGLVAVLVGFGISFLPENDGYGFLMGFLIGGGTVLLVTGKISTWWKKEE